MLNISSEQLQQQGSVRVFRLLSTYLNGWYHGQQLEALLPL